MSLVELLDKWQRILRLQDWDIIIKFVSPTELKSGREAEILIHRRYKRAYIKVVDPKYDWPNDHFDLEFNSPSAPTYLERLVLHELIHLVVYKFENEDQEEEIVEQLTKALLSLGAER